MIEKLTAFLKENGVELPDNLSNDDLLSILTTIVNADGGGDDDEEETNTPEPKGMGAK